nr:hypothetical protein [Corallococcus macrosporus]
MAVRQGGTVWAWGNNALGQLGDGTYAERPMPVQVPGLTGVTAISSGEAHTVAVGQGGTVWAWGNNALGQLGDGTRTDRHTPVQVPGLTGVTAISSGEAHTVAASRRCRCRG